jgi:hypothetical protein
MNLQDLRNKVKNITDYSPELQTYQDQVDDLINDAFYSIWTAKRWKFSQVQDFIKIYPDLNFGRTNKNINVLNGSRRVTFSGSVPMLLAEVSLGPFSSHDTAKSYGSVGSAYEGELIQINGREYTILKVVSDTEIRLAEPYRGGNVVDNISWVIKKRFYDLPEDCLELLNISQRDVPAPTNGGRPVFGKLSGLSKRKEEELNLREDYTSNYAECYIDTPPINVPPAEKLKEISQVYSAEATIPANTYFEICWAFYYLGAKIGPLSEPLLFKSQATQQGGPSTSIITLQFSTFDDKPIAAQVYASLSDYAPNKFEGLRKVLYYNSNFSPTTGKRLGLPVWRAITYGSAVGSEGASVDAPKPLVVGDEASQVVLQYTNSFNGGNPRYLEWDGSIPRIRPYPRINSFDFYNPAQAGGELLPKADEEYFRRLEVRYMKKPLRMGLATDTPQMPYEFHQLIVYGVLEDIYNKSGNTELADRYRVKIDKTIVGLERRYIDSVDTTFIRGSFTIGNDGFPFYDPTSLKLTP